jgi:ABC-type spermidine/putrescine transport system permease subunit II
VIVVIPMSFNDAALFEIIPSSPSITQYSRLFRNPEWMDVLGRSVRVAMAVTVLATVLGTLAALAVSKMPPRGRAAVEAAFISPQIVPSVVIAASAYYVFAWLGLTGTTVGIVITHTLLAFPFVLIIVSSRLVTIGEELSHASASLGANPGQTFLHVIMPQMSLAMVSGAVLAFHVSFDEVVLALFLSGVRSKTLPVKLWESILFEVSPMLPAVSTLALVIPLIVVLPILVWQYVRRRKRAIVLSGERGMAAGR